MDFIELWACIWEGTKLQIVQENGFFWQVFIKHQLSIDTSYS